MADISIQRAVPAAGIPAAASLRDWALAALGRERGELSIRIVGDDESRSLNRQYRGKDKPTNVLSFHYGDGVPHPTALSADGPPLSADGPPLSRCAGEGHRSSAVGGRFLGRGAFLAVQSKPMSARSRRSSARVSLWTLTPIAAALVALHSGKAAADPLAALRAAAAAVAPQNGSAGSGNGGASGAAAQAAALRALRHQARVRGSVDLARQAQLAARAAALQGASSVPNGLAPGGLDPVAPAETDLSGLNVWSGAERPTQQATAAGVQVDIRQSDERALLSWNSFNVGRETTLVFDQKDTADKPQTDWVVLNRVVGGIDPATGRRDPSLAPAPSQILGQIRADGTVLILNQNGVIFSGSSKVDARSLVASSLEVGRQRSGSGSTLRPTTIAERNQQFLENGLLGYADRPNASPNDRLTLSAQALPGTSSGNEPTPEGAIRVEAGAQLRSSGEGFLLLVGPAVENAGHLRASDGQVLLQAGRNVELSRASGAADSDDPNVRGVALSTQALIGDAPGTVRNSASGLIESERGQVYLGTAAPGSVINEGTITATTSVARNGYVQLRGSELHLAPGSTVAVLPDGNGETLPQDPVTLENFKRSRVALGDGASRVEIGREAMIYAPGGDIVVGAGAGATQIPAADPAQSRVFIDTGAILDASGLKDVRVPADRNAIRIRPVTRNELRDAPDYRDGFLRGTTVFVDPRLSGVRADGAAWIGSPLIDAASYYQQVGASVDELLTAGGNIVLGTAGVAASTGGASPEVIVRPGAEIDFSGGWLRYEAGLVRSSRLITADGRIVDIGSADPNGHYIGVYGGHMRIQPRWGVLETWSNPVLSGVRYAESYTEGRDAGSLTLKTPRALLEGQLHGQAHAGDHQRAGGRAGSAHSGVHGDGRSLQAVPSQLPAGGFLLLQQLSESGGSGLPFLGGGDIILRREDELAAAPAEDFTQTRLSDSALAQAGLAQLSLQTSGHIDLGAGTTLTLEAGGLFSALAGRGIDAAGVVQVEGGRIRLETADFGIGSVFEEQPRVAGAFDIRVEGQLLANGRWINDGGRALDLMQGPAWLDGGRIELVAAARVSSAPYSADDASGVLTAEDLSGSILLGDGALLDVSAGGQVRPDGSLDLSAQGGDVALTSETGYYQLSDAPGREGGLAGFRVRPDNSVDGVAINPDSIRARIVFGSHNFRAHGFEGGGTFRLVTPALAFGAGAATVGSRLPMDFFSESGFGSFELRSNRTAFIANEFNNGLGGSHAVLATQTLRVGAGDSLRLSQSLLPVFLDAAQEEALRALASGGDLYSVLAPGIPGEAWDRLAANLSLEGLLELQVEAGGRIEGDPGATLRVGGLLNQGHIHLPGGRILQSAELLRLYGAGPENGGGVIAVRDLDEVLRRDSNGLLREAGASALPGASNAEVLLDNAVYLLGALDAGEGIRLDAGSVTDLAGVSVRDPRAREGTPAGERSVARGRLYAGGTLASLPQLQTATRAFASTQGLSVFAGFNADAGEALQLLRAARALNIEPGAQLDLSGASDVHDQRQADGSLQPQPVWSAAGSLSGGNGGRIAGADIRAHGGSPQAAGGTLTWLDPVLRADAPAADAAHNRLAVTQLQAAGFDALLALGSVAAEGDVSLALERAFILETRPYAAIDNGDNLDDAATRDAYAPTLRAGGALDIAAPYIRLDSAFQALTLTPAAPSGAAQLSLRAAALDIQGAIRIDSGFGSVVLQATGDLRLIGTQPYQTTFFGTSGTSLAGELRTPGELAISAGQVYPTTGSSFTLAAGGDVRLAGTGTTPAAPYSAGGSLAIEGRNIEQGGVLRAPLGTLTLSARETLSLAPGSLSSVSAEGLSIPYGTTQDQKEWFFAPTSLDPLTAPPRKELRLNAADLAIDEGATVDLSGGGDAYAYEFIPGVGGSRDVLARENPDLFSGNDGLQYADGRQVYAIVPGLSDKPVAAYDPIYAAGYGDLESVDGAGRRVWLEGAPGLAAGWYTLLPARYALLPGGLRVVERSGALDVALPATRLRDGRQLVAGRYGGAGGSEESTLRLFDVQAQDVFRKYSNIALTSGDALSAQRAAREGLAAPRLAADAGRLVLNPAATLSVAGTLRTQAASGGRGAQADIGGRDIEIVDALPEAPVTGRVYLSAPSLTRLNASSLLIGGVRTDEADGTTLLDLTASQIRIANSEAAPLSAPELILGVDGAGAAITLADGASIVASGTLGDARDGSYVIDGSRSGQTGTGALLRVANGPERLVARRNIDAGVAASALQLGDAQLAGAAVLVESSGGFAADPGLRLETEALAVGASRISFAAAADAADGLVVTPELQALLGQSERLSFAAQSGIDFSGGRYVFGDLRLDGPLLGSLDGGDVQIEARRVELSNRLAAAAACDPDCGAAQLGITAEQIVLGPGSVRSDRYGAGLTLSASSGIGARGDAALDAGAAAVTLNTPFLGDIAQPLATGQRADIPALRLSTTGALNIVAPEGSRAAAPAGIPGASLQLQGGSIRVAGTQIRATAGVVELQAQEDLVVSAGARIEAPSHVRDFGADSDRVTQASPGGRVSLGAAQGDLRLEAGTQVSVGGSAGRAGRIELLAHEGSLQLDGSLDARAPQGGGALRLDSGSAIDLQGLGAQAQAQGFTHALDIRSGSGDLLLAAGQTLRAEALRLSADGGAVDIAGRIDVSGVNGGSVALSGAAGVTLRSGAQIDAHAEGYAADDSRRAEGGRVSLATAGSGALRIEDGAQIDLSARRPQDRLLPVTGARDAYWFVEGDRGGRLELRAALQEQPGADRVAVQVAPGSVLGADEVQLEASRRYDLADPALGLSIVTDADGHRTALLDPGSQAFFSDPALAGGLVQAIRDFDVSASDADLGGLAAQAGFHARPGIELAFDGDLRLLNPWNLAAAQIDLDAAVAGGALSLSNDGVYSLVAGQEARLIEDYAQMLYRVGGRAGGEAGVLTLHAGGTLGVGATLSDGFFQFRNQADANFLAQAIRGSATAIPFSVDANSVSPTGAAFASAELFPLLADGSAMDSWSLRLAAGGDLVVEGETSYSYGSGGSKRTVYESTLIRSGTGDITLSAGGDVDLRNGTARYRTAQGNEAINGFLVGGSAVYTAGRRADLGARILEDSGLVLNAGAFPYAGNFSAQRLRDYRYGTGFLPGAGQAGILLADPLAAEDGGDVAIAAGGDVLGRRNVHLEHLIGGSTATLSTLNFVGTGSQPWRAGRVNTAASDFGNTALTRILTNPQLFSDGIGTLGGGDIRVRAGRDVVDLTVAATNSLLTATLGDGSAGSGRALQAFGHGDARVDAGRDLVAGRLDIASGTAVLNAGRDIADMTMPLTPGRPPETNALRVLLSDAVVALAAGGQAELQGIAALGTQSLNTGEVQANLNARGLYTPHAAVSILANGTVAISNANALAQTFLSLNGPDLQVQGNPGVVSAPSTVVYPGTLRITSLTGDLLFQRGPTAPRTVLLYSSRYGQLELYAGGDIAPVTLAMEDTPATQLPGLFSAFALGGAGSEPPLAGRAFLFPYVLPDTPEVQRQRQHSPTPLHQDDPLPVRIHAGEDIRGLTLSMPKQTRLHAGRDLVDTMYFVQNLRDSDISMASAGRDITATTRLVQAAQADGARGPALPALQGNAFVIGGPGTLILDAGRDAGPFLNSAQIEGASAPDGRRSGLQRYAGGVISVGNEWNPYLPEQGADIHVSFGVAPGADYAGLRDRYLDPASFAALDDDLFEQVDGQADRSRPLYVPQLVAWMQTQAGAELQAAYGRSEVSYAEAYAAFKNLPLLRQRLFLVDELFFNELAQTAIPDGPSFQQYSRGYRAIEALFPAELGYTRNALDGSGSGAVEGVETGDLDLRLAAIATLRGGDIRILGPGGRVLGGSVVRTDQQAARRNFEGGRLFAAGLGNPTLLPPPIAGIPAGFEGVQTQRGGDIGSFTDGDLLLNQSRLFTLAGGDISLWSSNGDLNAGQGPKTSANFPPVVVRVDQDAVVTRDSVGGVTGAGIAAFKPAPGEPDPSVYLMAPRGTIDAGDAGVRVAGNLFLAAQTVSNAEGFEVGGEASGVAGAGAGAVPAISDAASTQAATQAAEAAQAGRDRRDLRSVITVQVVGPAADADAPAEDEEERKRRQRRAR